MNTFATIRDTAQTLREMIRVASAGYHPTVYVRVVGSEDTVNILAQTNGQQVMSYCTFTDLNHVEGDAEAVIPVGLDSDTKGYLDYLDFAEGSNEVEMTFQGTESDGDHPRLAERWHAAGGLEAGIRLPDSDDDLQGVPWLLPDRWTDDNQYISRAAIDDETGEVTVDKTDLPDYVPPTIIETTAETVRDSIIEPADFMDAVHSYPIVTNDGAFRVDLEGNKGDDTIRGEVNAERVDGPDVSRQFDDGFDTAFDELDGPVTLATAPDTPEGQPSPPLVVTQDNRSGRTVRHVLGPFAED